MSNNLNKELIIKLYQIDNKKAQDIANEFDCSRQTILNFLRINNIQIRKRKDYNKYPCNNSYFEKINNEAKAYFLGLLYADGNISKGIKSLVTLTLQENDKDILNKFKKELEYDCPLSFNKSKNENRKNTFTLYICNNKLKKDLINLGCVPAKSLILKFPTEEQVPYDLIHHFIRGYFDGDGCISLSGTPTLSILSTESMINNINFIIDIETNIGMKKLEIHPNGINKQYRISGKRQIQKVFNFLYKDSNFFLKRKYDKFKQLLEVK